ncbi:hypothetical protein [Cohaesibacter sp. CAU 1516]|uniref:hypothetical protein n=1 Tax=Cohaesibacter sp. CAU 1516 TaxID=2576038 RepID=UPI001AEEAD58|nr:hypothetical protein [Cohaesibacter sp. CAU 1516]
MIANLKHWVIMSFAILCLIGGLATVWLPIPTGVPLLALGSFLVIANSRIGRSYARRLRKHIGWLDLSALWLEERAGRTFGRVLKTTRPLVTRHRQKAHQKAIRSIPADAAHTIKHDTEDGPA